MILSHANSEADANSDTGAGAETDGATDGGAAVRPGPTRAGELRTKVFHSSGGLTVINESLNVGKHFISASSVFIRQGQPLAGRERAVTFITRRREKRWGYGGRRPPIGPIKTAARRSPSLIIIIVTGTGRCTGCASAAADPPKDHVPVCWAARRAFLHLRVLILYFLFCLNKVNNKIKQ